MFYDKEISILSEGGYTDDNGLWVEGEVTVVKIIDCDVQPFNKELAYRDYSFSEDVKYRVFCEPDPLIKLGTSIAYQEQFKYEETVFNVVKIVPWNEFWVVLLDD